ncbi:MAG: cation-transporting P-type ATPase [Desulfotomaculaceae bacterium]|nr:cation-transporting P-type ATPase [Desulfotomaculaceae bacterium]
MSGHWYSLTTPEISERLQTDEKNGLSEPEAKARKVKFGPNDLSWAPGAPLWSIFINQFNSYLVLVLLFVSAYLGLSGAYPQAVAIMIMIAARAVLGVIKECLAEHSKTILRQLTASEVKVIRDGRKRMIPALELVPGDLVLLEKGDLVPADIRLIEADRLSIDELALTEETRPVEKAAETLPDTELPLTGTFNMAYQGTTVTGGSGRGVVVQTGMATEAGFKASFVREDGEEDTPLQRRLAQITKTMSVPYLLVGLLIIALGISRSGETEQMLLLVICLAAAAGPWDLPAVVTLHQAAGARRLISRGVFMRKLSSMEKLGDITVLCTSKTGTLTQNKMTVRQVILGGQAFQVTGEGYDPKGNFIGVSDRHKQHFDLFMKAAALCNNAHLQRGDISVAGIFRGPADRRPVEKWSIKGEPTEGALLVMAAKAGFWRERIEIKEKRAAELPFSSERKRMTVVYRRPAGEMDVFVKGTPEMILDLCTHTYKNGRILPLSARERKELLQQIDLMASDSQRVLAFAWRTLPASAGDYSEEHLEQQLVFLGLAGMTDLLRPDAVKAMRSCRRAGVRVTLLTGDHQSAALALAGKLGIINNGRVLTGTDLDQVPEAQLLELVNQVSVYARVSPEKKRRVIQALKKSGQVVAAAGSGGGDAPALKAADIGIAMGINGANLTKGAADIILDGDHFSGIIAAIEEGRGCYDNARKVISHLLSGSVGLVLTVIAAALAGLPGLLTPVQILWAGLIAGALPAMALGMGPGDPESMERTLSQPHYSSVKFITHGLAGYIATKGLMISLCTLTIFWIGLSLGGEALARAMAFNTLVFCQLSFIFNSRLLEYTVIEKGFLSNLPPVGAVLISVVLQLLLNYVPWLQSSFHTVYLSGWHWTCILALAVLPAVLVALRRHFTGRTGKKVVFLKV